MPTTQISAYISDETKVLMESYSKKSGIKKGFLIEEALLHHLQALKELPVDIMIPARLTLTENSLAQVISVLKNSPQPTEALKTLMRNG